MEKPILLIVDDHNDISAAFTAWLEDEGFQVLSASNCMEALRILHREAVKTALFNLHLDTKNGLKAAKTLKNADQYLKIIIITGFPSYNAAVETMKSGMFDYLSLNDSKVKILGTIIKAVRAREMEILEKRKTPQGDSLINVVTLCNHSVIKERLRTFFRHYPDFKLLKDCGSLKELKGIEDGPEIDIALICATCCTDTFDNCYEFFHELYQPFPSVKPAIFNECFTPQEKVELIRAGVRGFFSIDADSQRIKKALLSIHKGELWISRQLVTLALSHGPDYLENVLRGRESFGLSPREKEILKAMVQGLQNNEIGDRLFISENTVKSHINKLYKKLGVRNRAQAICCALDKKILCS